MLGWSLAAGGGGWNPLICFALTNQHQTGCEQSEASHFEIAQPGDWPGLLDQCKTAMRLSTPPCRSQHSLGSLFCKGRASLAQQRVWGRRCPAHTRQRRLLPPAASAAMPQPDAAQPQSLLTQRAWSETLPEIAKFSGPILLIPLADPVSVLGV